MTQPPATPIAPPQRTSGAAITALVLGVIALAGSCLVIGGALGVVAVIVGLIAMAGIGKSSGQLKGKGFALAGVITGAIAIPLSVLPVFLMFSAMSAARVDGYSRSELSNLRQIGLAQHAYATDWYGRFPPSPSLAMAHHGGGGSDLLTSPFGPASSGGPAGVQLTDDPIPGTDAVRLGDMIFLHLGADVGQLADPWDTVTVFGVYPDPREGTHAVVFADGSARRVDRATLQALLGDDWTPALEAELASP